MKTPDALRLDLPVSLVVMREPAGGLVLTDHGELALCGGKIAAVLPLSAEQWAWLAHAAAYMAVGLSEENAMPLDGSLLPFQRCGVGHA